MDEAAKQLHIERMHHACRLVRLAIAVLDADVPPDESTVKRLEEALALLEEERRELGAAVHA